MRYKEITSDLEDYQEDLDKFSLWWADVEEAGVREVWIAEEAGEVLGFITLNRDNQAIAIETLPKYRGHGIGSKLVEKSGAIGPEDNQAPGFWKRFEEEED